MLRFLDVLSSVFRQKAWLAYITILFLFQEYTLYCKQKWFFHRIRFSIFYKPSSTEVALEIENQHLEIISNEKIRLLTLYIFTI